MSTNSHNLRVIEPSALALRGDCLDSPIELLRRDIAKGHHVQRHRHPWGQLIYASSGVFSVTTDNNQFIIPAGQSVWIPYQAYHAVTALSDIRLCSFYITEDEAQSLPGTSRVLRIAPLTQQLIAKAATNTTDADWHGQSGRLLRLIRDFFSNSEEVPLNLPLPKDRRLRHAIELLNETPRKLSLDELGKLSGLSARSLSRVFRRETGLSFSQWRTRLCLQQAVNLLDEGYPVCDVAERLGYQSPSAFIYMFRQHMGCSPTSYNPH